jgi:hypothetical protein
MRRSLQLPAGNPIPTQLLPHTCAGVHQVYISYGPKPSGELLLCYGFHPPPGSNPYESAPLTLQLGDKDPQYPAKAAALASRWAGQGGKGETDISTVHFASPPAENMTGTSQQSVQQ